MTTVEEFSEQFFQDVVGRADANGTYMEEEFFECAREYIEGVGDLEEASYAPYIGMRGTRAFRVDGYGGDPLLQDGVLSVLLLDFEQPPSLATLTATDMETYFKRGRNFLLNCLEESFRNGLEETSPAFGLADLISQRWPTIEKVRFFLISNRRLSQRVDGRKADEIEGKAATYNVWDITRFHRVATEGDRPEEIYVDLAEDFGGAIPALEAHLDDARYAGYLMVLPGETLAQIYDRWGTRLLEQNVRVFLQARGKVNQGIKGTIENDPTMFFAYNNGLSATAEHVDLVESGSAVKISGLKNLQIVNGGQTTASIHAAFRKKVDLSDLFVQVKLSLVNPAEVEEVVPKISEFANTQNRVSAADFFANHPFHIRIEQFSRRIYAPSPDGSFRESKWFYERARGQYQEARSRLSAGEQKKFDIEYPKRQKITKTDLAKYGNAWRGFPHMVSLGAQKNFAHYANHIGTEWRRDEKQFNEEFFRDALSRAILFQRVESLVTKQPWYQSGYRANIVAYTVAKFAFDFNRNGRSVDLRKVWVAQAIPDYLVPGLEMASKVVFEILTAADRPITNVTEWAKREAVWTQVQAATVNWPAESNRILLDDDDKRERFREARKDQTVLNGIAAQSKVVNAGASTWSSILTWGVVNGGLSDKDKDILQTAMSIPAKLPSERQSEHLVALVKRLQARGCPLGKDVVS